MKKVIFAAVISAVCLLSGCSKIESRTDLGKSSYVPITDSQLDHYYQAVNVDEDSSDSDVLPAEDSEKTTRVVLVGDSRAIQLGNTVYGVAIDDDHLVDEETSDGDCILGAVGEGYDWLAEHTLEIEDKLTDGCALVVNMGVNGVPYYHREIAGWCNEMAEKYKDMGVKVYFMSVNPVNDRLMKYYDYTIRNVDVIYFNSAIRTELRGVTYLDTYSVVKDDILGEGSGTFDGLHYYEDVYRKIRDYMWKVTNKA